MKVKTALISVSDKTGLLDFAKRLEKLGVKIISSGGTWKALNEAGIKAVKVEDFTGFPEMLDGRVKTLHQKIHAGILAKRNKEHLAEMKKHSLETIDLVAVNLYPFRETVSKQNVSLEEAIENIDIGGPTMIRAAAKNFESVGVVVEHAQYEKVLRELETKGELSEQLKKELCLEAFQHTAFYDSMVSQYLSKKFSGPRFPEKLSLGFEKAGRLRYGENPHQEAALYKNPLENGNLIDAEQLNGKELSFNNYGDANAAIAIAREFQEPCAVIVKHANPCGVATAQKLSDAFRKALECDPESAFGGIIALNKKCDIETARQITAFFNEVVIAPAEYDANALQELKAKKNLRVLRLKTSGKTALELDFRHISGGLLAQENDSIRALQWENKSGIEPGKEYLNDLEFAWKIVRHVKSNAIVLAKNNATIGIGAGQTSRVKAVRQALEQADVKAHGAVLASDAFFPFKDSIELIAKAGIKAVVEPGGSIKDEEVIAEAKKLGIALYFTGERHFRH